MAPRIHERTRDRVSAVQVLYTSELTGKSPSELLDCGLCLVAREAPADEAEAAEAGAFGRIEEGTLTDYALALIHGVEANQAQVDERIEAASENWALSRMPIVDRSILRLAVFEMFNCDDVPVSVSINEAMARARPGWPGLTLLPPARWMPWWAPRARPPACRWGCRRHGRRAGSHLRGRARASFRDR